METPHSSSGEPSVRAKAFQVVKEKSFTLGDFTLASGKKSNYYLDLKPAMFDPEGAGCLARLVLERVRAVNADCVGGLEMGAVPLVATVSMLSASTGKPIPGFFVRKTVKDHGTKKKIEAVRDLNGKKVVILEDVTTTGLSAMQAVAEARGGGGEVTLVLSVVDREEGAAEFYNQNNIRFESLFKASDFTSSASS